MVTLRLASAVRDMAKARPRKSRDAEATRQAILAAATAEFARKGLGGARVDEIAARARANKRMIYHYFGNKEGLYLAALERVYEGLRGSERTLDLAHLDPELAITRLVELGVQPFLDAWRNAGGESLATYKAGSEGPPEADHLLAGDGRRWRPIESGEKGACA